MNKLNILKLFSLSLKILTIFYLGFVLGGIKAQHSNTDRFNQVLELKEKASAEQVRVLKEHIKILQERLSAGRPQRD